MVRMVRWGIFLVICFLLAIPGGSFGAGGEDVLMYGRVTDTGVVQRSGPSGSSPVLGTFDEEHNCRELLVTGRRTAPDGDLWYRVESNIFGEGWMDEQSVEADIPETPLERLSLEIRFACGITPALAEKKLGAPKNVTNGSFDIPEYEMVVETRTLSYDGCELVYWDGLLSSVAVSGAVPRFGGLAVGGDVQGLIGLLGEPTERKARKWLFADESTELLVTGDKAGTIASFRFAMIMYE